MNTIILAIGPCAIQADMLKLRMAPLKKDEILCIQSLFWDIRRAARECRCRQDGLSIILDECGPEIRFYRHADSITILAIDKRSQPG
jgi:hypothetical protein